MIAEFRWRYTDGTIYPIPLRDLDDAFSRWTVLCGGSPTRSTLMNPIGAHAVVAGSLMPRVVLRYGCRGTG